MKLIVPLSYSYFDSIILKKLYFDVDIDLDNEKIYGL